VCIVDDATRTDDGDGIGFFGNGTPLQGWTVLMMVFLPQFNL